MGLDGLIRSGIALAKSVTTDLQATVSHAPFSSADAYGLVTYGSAVNRKALVEFKPRMVRTPTGQEKVSRATVTFLQPVLIDLRDQITLPDGTTGPILSVDGMVDPTTEEPYMQQVYIA